MKLKYYLRGVGIGIIFATLVMTVSSLVHKYNLSDEYIIKEARKLGMVMQDEVKNEENGLWGGSDSDDTYLEVTEETESSEAEDIPATEIESESESESQEPEAPVVPETPVVQEEPVIPDEPVVNDDANYVTIVVKSGYNPRQVGEQLVAAGIIENEEEFMRYVSEHGLSKKLHQGEYSIPKEATLEEVCDIIF